VGAPGRPDYLRLSGVAPGRTTAAARKGDSPWETSLFLGSLLTPPSQHLPQKIKKHQKYKNQDQKEAQ
ncbi:hypothetical protein H8959_002366, partial [Pygathrix nigripes]